METSEKGWVRIAPDSRFWIPCPAAFPEGITRESWAAEMARFWWEQSGVPHPDSAVGQLARMLSYLQENAYASIPCHQIWIYLRDLDMAPLPVYIGIWNSVGEREQRLRLLAGADDKASVRKPEVCEVETTNLGTGLRVLRYRTTRKNPLVGVLSYGFRSEEFETDVQIVTGSARPSQLTAATVLGDIDDFIRAMTVYSNTSKPRYV